MTNFVLKTTKFVLEMTKFVFKMTKFVLQTMNFAFRYLTQSPLAWSMMKTMARKISRFLTVYHFIALLHY